MFWYSYIVPYMVKIIWALSTTGLNLFGSLAMTALGWWTWHLLRVS